jgi:hypothetical protein
LQWLDTAINVGINSGASNMAYEGLWGNGEYGNAFASGFGWGFAGSAAASGIGALTSKSAGVQPKPDSNVFNKDGTLKHAMIKNHAKKIIKGEGLKSPFVVSELTKDGSKISDWGKYITKTPLKIPGIHVPGYYQVHFYHNPSAGLVNYNIDYKTVFGKGYINR